MQEGIVGGVVAAGGFLPSKAYERESVCVSAYDDADEDGGE